MQLHKQGPPCWEKMFISPDNNEEDDSLRNFARVDEPLTAKICVSPDYKYSYLQLERMDSRPALKKGE